MHLLIEVRMPGRPPYGGTPTRKPGTQQLSTVSTETQRNLRKLPVPGRLKVGRKEADKMELFLPRGDP